MTPCRHCGHPIERRHAAGADRWCAVERIAGEPVPWCCRRTGPGMAAIVRTHEPEPPVWRAEDFDIRREVPDYRVVHRPTAATLGTYATRAAARRALAAFLDHANERENR